MAGLGDFVHLHLHSQFSMLDGACSIKPLISRVKELGMGAVALTDHGNLCGALQFQKACEGADVRPIFGAELYLSPTTRFDRTSPLARTRHHFLLLCENLEGWRNLSRLSSLAYIEGHYYKPRIDLELLEKYHGGLIATSACIQGPVAQAILSGAMHEAQKYVDTFAQIFGPDHFYLELMDHGIEEQRRVNAGLIELARKNNLPLVATNDCHYLSEASFDAHDVLLCIQMGKTLSDPSRMRFEQNEFYVKSPEQMIGLFGHLDGAITNTVAIAERCDCKIPLHQKLLPRYRTPGGETSEDYLRMLLERGIRKRYGDPPPEHVRQRADFELDVILKMGFTDYFLVVWDFINWAKEHKIPVGPGRGSGAGSIVAYALEITNLEPLEHGLLFERFLNPERVSMPDFDIDFCFERRGEVIEYVRQKYGNDCVSQIITFGSMKARNSIRDVGRVMGMELPAVDRVAKLVPGGPKVTIQSALDEVHDLRELYENEPEVRELIDRAKGVEGAIRQPGTHAAGVVICDQPLIDLVPLYKPPEEGALVATQFTMTEVEELGLLKMDFLGLKNLTLIDKCLKTINAREGSALRPDDIPLEDEKTYKLLQAGKGLGVFQLESSGMRDLLVNFKPTHFSDLVALISLYRPGPMDNIPDFIARKEGRAEITYAHPDMAPILKETYGLFVYQEQVMQVAQVLGGYSLGGADLLRRAMSKKKAEAMAKEREKFVAGCLGRGIDEATAAHVFDTMEKFAAYGFNKSHAAAYAVVTVQTAWLKAHYPVDFYSALITNEIGGEDAKITLYFGEAREEGINVMPPDINTSGVNFAPFQGQIRFGMVSVKGVGQTAVESIIAEREKNGPYKSFQDFVSRSEKKHLNIRTVECLIKCGAFDAFGYNRPSLLAVLPRVMESAGTARRDADDAQASLFDMMSEDQTAGLKSELPIPRLADWSEKERLEVEKELTGFYLSGHPLQRYEADFAAFSSYPAAELAHRQKGEEVCWVGLIRRLVPRTDRNGRMFAFVECEDSSGPMEVSVFADTFEKSHEALKEGEVIWVRGKLDTWKDAIKLIAWEVRPIDAVRAELIRVIEVAMPWTLVSEANLTRVKEAMARHKGRRRLWFVLRGGEDGELRMEATNGYGIQPSSTLIRELQEMDFIKGLRFVAKDPRDRGED